MLVSLWIMDIFILIVVTRNVQLYRTRECYFQIHNICYTYIICICNIYNREILELSFFPSAYKA